MQQDLIRMVAERTGMSEDKARSAAETVIGYLRDKLPEPMSSQLDSIAGGGTTSGRGGDISRGIGDMASGLGTKLPGRE